MRILLVEDDEILGDAVQAWLTQEKYSVDWIRRGDQASVILKNEDFSLIILDIGLPGCSGLDILKQLRSRKTQTPVLILTARDTLADRVTGLDLGADDYLVKPFDMSELSARIRAVIRRSKERATPLLSNGELILNPATMGVTLQGDSLVLTGREYALLHCLMECQNHIVSRTHLGEMLYGYDSDMVESNTIEVHISHLRQKIGKGIIKTVRGIGYTISA